MIGRNSNMGCTPLHHPENTSKHSSSRSNLLALFVRMRWDSIEMPEQLISPVYEISVQVYATIQSLI